MSINSNIKFYRNLMNISQRELGRRINKTGQLISSIEQGKTTPSIDTINKIALALEIPVNYLLGKDETCSQYAISKLLEKGVTLDELSEVCNVSIDELKNLFVNGNTNLDTLKKIFNTFNFTDKEVANILIQDKLVTSINNSNEPTINILKKLLHKENIKLDDILPIVNEEDKKFLKQMFTNNPITTPQNNNPMNEFTEFLKSNNYPVDKLNKEMIECLYNKTNDFLEFEFFRLEKNNFNVSND